MADAWIEGRPAALDAAVAEAAKLLAASRLPVVAGLGTDVAGARAALALAQQIGGVVDHMHAGAMLRELDLVRTAGTLLTTPNEAALRADTLLLVGPGLATAWPEIGRELLGREPDRQWVAGRRRVFWLCPGSSAPALGAEGAPIERLGTDPAQLKVTLGALRARIGGRPCGPTALSAQALEEVAAALAAARFGVAVWADAALDSLAIAMLGGIIDDLNATTRFCGLPLSPADNAAGVLQVCGWLSGLPLRTSFARRVAEHDPWRFAARRLIDSGESDCVLWISAYRPAPPDWEQDVPMIALTAPDAGFRRPPRVLIAVGRPGVDHDGIERIFPHGALAAVAATRQSPALSVAQAIVRITSALPSGQAAAREMASC
jgi:formylmethanofuran dehydrogenase subunit B